MQCFSRGARTGWRRLITINMSSHVNIIIVTSEIWAAEANGFNSGHVKSEGGTALISV